MNDLYQYVTSSNVLHEIVSSTQHIDYISWFDWLRHILDIVNSWAYSHIGITLINVLKAIAAFFVWILQFMVDVIKQGMALL